MSKHTMGPTPGLSLEFIQAARKESDSRGWRSPEWTYIRYLLDLLEARNSIATGPAYHTGYRAGWNDAIDEIAREIETQRRE